MNNVSFQHDIEIVVDVMPQSIYCFKPLMTVEFGAMVMSNISKKLCFNIEYFLEDAFIAINVKELKTEVNTYRSKYNEKKVQT